MYADAIQLAYGTGTAWYKTGDESKLDQNCIDSAKMAIGLNYHHLGTFAYGIPILRPQAYLRDRRKVYLLT